VIQRKAEVTAAEAKSRRRKPEPKAEVTAAEAKSRRRKPEPKAEVTISTTRREVCCFRRGR